MCEIKKPIVVPRKVGMLAEVFPREFLPDIIRIFKDAYVDFQLRYCNNAGIGDISQLADFYPDFDPNPLLEFLGFNFGEGSYTENSEISPDERLERFSSFIALLELRGNEVPARPDHLSDINVDAVRRCLNGIFRD